MKQTRVFAVSAVSKFLQTMTVLFLMSQDTPIKAVRHVHAVKDLTANERWSGCYYYYNDPMRRDSVECLLLWKSRPLRQAGERLWNFKDSRGPILHPAQVT